MGVLKSTGKILGVFINVRVDQWIGLSDHIQNTKYIASQAKNLFSPEEASRTESFEDAMVRLNITEEQLESSDKYFTFLIRLYIFMALLITAYSLYQMLIVKSALSTIMTFSLVLYALANSFRYHFWRFQIRSRKLGCSFRDWLNN